MLGKIVILGALLVVTVAELPVNSPYAPSGWRPQGRPFNIQSSYFAPLRNAGLELEITKERVVHAGQLRGNRASLVTPSSAYLPSSSYNPDEPSNVDILRVQGLPIRPSSLFKIISTSELNSREYYRQRQFAPQNSAGNIRQQQFKSQRLNPVRASASQYEIPAKQPANQYSAPAAEPVGYPDSKTQTDNDFEEENLDLADEAVTKGEYFVLTPEKTLQKVTYKTSQTAEEARNNGFTAELKYRLVDKVDGPLYKYNEQGQLVRIYKK